jgi:hypothetical protein
MKPIVALADPGARRTEARIDLPGEGPQLVRWELPIPPSGGGDFLLPLVLPVAMRVGHDLRLEAEVSTAMLQRVDQIQSLYRGWDSSLDLIEVDCAAEVVRGPRTDSPGVGSCFSGGVDSFHTALTHHEELTSLLHVQGFDIRHDRHEPGI